MKIIILLLATVTSCVTYGYYSTNELPNIEMMKEKEFFDSIEQDFVPEIIGHIKVKKIFVHLFFLSRPYRQRAALRKKALDKAKDRYGHDINLANLDFEPESGKFKPIVYTRLETKLANIEFESRWHILSLIFGGSILGWVEKATIEAAVVRQPSTSEILPTHESSYLVGNSPAIPPTIGFGFTW
ncbi:MAG TPA: hypothetical protein ENI27_10700 [bacterium]|nr:hypothetical protein [bacterium]